LPENKLSADDVRQLYIKHGAALVLYACSFVSNSAAAEDVVHGVFLRLLRGQQTVPDIPAAYLYRAVRNAALNARRDRSREEPLPKHESWLNHRAGDRNAALALEKAMRALPEEQMEIVVMWIWGGMTLEEAAEAAGVPLNTAASRYRYALAKLREQLKPHERFASEGEEHER
jgi:RNA polymerase sigma-70 factor (ECF subfamily)